MILCFGIFAKILLCCTKNMAQVKFIPRITWVIDRKNLCLSSELNFPVEDPDGMEGNSTYISRLLSCKRPLTLKEEEEYRPSIETARERFGEKVMPFLVDDKIAKAIVAILYIIERDEAISTKRKETFKQYLGQYKDELLKQTEFNVPDFFARVLLYTTCCDNEEGKPYAEDIDNSFIEKAVEESRVDLKWDAATQTAEIKPTIEKLIFERICELAEWNLLVGQSRHNNDWMTMNFEWLGVDMHELFPNYFPRIKFKDSKEKATVAKKIAQSVKLVHELMDILVEKNKPALSEEIQWPVRSNEQINEICQQLETISSEVWGACMFSDWTISTD